MVKGKKIGISHFVYTCIIALLIILFISVFAFGGNKDAGNQVNVMATGISIILAVIAILMTLVDVAGQRQSIIDIKETAKELSGYQELAQEKITELLLAMDKVDELKNTMKSNTAELKNFTEVLLKEEFEVQGTLSKEQLTEIKSKINNKFSELDQRLNVNLRTTNFYGNQSKKIIFKFREWVKTTFPESDTEEYGAFLDKVYDSFDIYEVKCILHYLKDSGATYIKDAKKIVDLRYIKEIPPQNS